MFVEDIEMFKINELLAEYNGIFKDLDKSYHDAAKAVGLSDSAFWILYTLRESCSEMTQSDIVSMISFPPQTVNSALMKLKDEGYVMLRSIADRRKKLILLTDKGEQLAEKTVDRVMEIEAMTMGSLTEQEQRTFLRLFRKHTDMLKNNLLILKERRKNE